MEVVDEDEVEEMELGELDLDVIEEEYGNNGHGYVPRSKLSFSKRPLSECQHTII